MTLLGRALDGVRAAGGGEPSGLAQPAGWLRDLAGGLSTHAGVNVTTEGSMGLVPVYSAVSLLGGAVGSLPLNVYRRLDGDGKELATNHRTWKLLHDQPNDLMAADEVWEVVEACLALWGNAFLVKGRDPVTGLVNELVPVHPSRISVGRRKDGEPLFALDGKGPYTRADILHIRGLSFDGLVGLSPIRLMRQMIGNAFALEEFSGRFWANNARPGVLLRHPETLSEEAAKRLKAQWDAAHGGLANIAKTAILEEGMEVETIGMPLEDAQLVDQMRLTDIRVAQMFRLPPALLLANPGTSLTYSTTEGQGIDFVRWSLRRWLVRIESSLVRDPDLFVQGQRFFPKFDVSELLRADTKTLAETWNSLVDNGVAIPNEAREALDLNRLDTTEFPSAGKLRDPAVKAANAKAKTSGPAGPSDQSKGGGTA